MSKDSCVSYQGMTLELPRGPEFRHFARKTVKVHEYPNGSLALFHGPRHLASYTAEGKQKGQTQKAAA